MPLASLNGTPITTSGAGAAGLFANAGTIAATNTTTQTSGAAAPGGILSNGGTVTINGGSVTTTGAGSFGFLFEPFLPPPLTPPPPGPNTLAINSTTVNSAADAFHVTGAVADITVIGSSITSGNGVLLNTLSSGTTNLTATGSQLTGCDLRRRHHPWHPRLESPFRGREGVFGGRLYLYALAAAGQAAVERALENLRAEIERDMKLMGCRSVDQLSRDNLRFR